MLKTRIVSALCVSLLLAASGAEFPGNCNDFLHERFLRS